MDSNQDSLSDDEDIRPPARPLDERLMGVVIGGTVVAILLLLGVVVFCLLRRRCGRKKYVACGGTAPAAVADICRVPSGFHAVVGELQAGGARPLMSTAVVGNGKMMSNGIVYDSVETCDDVEVRSVAMVLVSGDCLEGKRENYQVCSVQHCVQQLCTV